MKHIKSPLLLLLCCFIILSCEKKENIDNEKENTEVNSNVKLGDFVSGGYVFYIKPDKSGGLVFAPSDVTDNTVAWGCKGLQISGLSAEVGDGIKNTQTIVSSCSETNTAAKLCDLYASGGFSDWALPSEKELGLIISVCYEANSIVKNEHKLNPNDYYWTSTQVDNNTAIVNMGKGQLKTGKFRDDKHRVRAIRSF